MPSVLRCARLRRRARPCLFIHRLTVEYDASASGTARPSLQVVSSEPCPACGGTGFVKNIESMGLEVMRALKGTLDREDISLVEARVSPEVAGYFKGRLEELKALEEKHKKRIHLTPTRELASNRVEFSCYNLAGEKVFDFVR